MFLIIKRLWQVNWAEQWQYRANLLMYLLYWLVSPIIYLAVWTSIANQKGSVNGFTANDFITYYMVLLICDQVTSNIVIHTFGYKIQDGTLSGELVRPIHPMLTNGLVNNIAFKALTMMGLTPIWIILYFLYKPDFSSMMLRNILLALPAMILAFFIGYLLSASITSLAFWTTRVYSIHEFYFALILLFSGQFVPLTLMPKVVQDIAQYLPFQLLIYFPIQLILGKLSAQQIAQGYVMSLIWLGISGLLFYLVWRNGVKRYSAVGA
ncbi:MAG: ABC-2 family transporter protein [Anaerolineales bacterium]|uniref:ABC transporter permease n=1 Tax=Candidatus Villigracilis saccharophilus TaxID=3140684 RepID=UPI0031346962|nr:ABC-2 family transporter protein [Anaerolineales bacterium]MBK8420573.1 ABC-2 family transporter protein [Anaerolineales bacterium]